MTEKRNCAISQDKEGLTIPQANFLEFCKKFGWGKLEVTVKDGQPVMVVPIRQETKLD